MHTQNKRPNDEHSDKTGHKTPKKASQCLLLVLFNLQQVATVKIRIAKYDKGNKGMALRPKKRLRQVVQIS